jgi:hypothetical protein
MSDAEPEQVPSVRDFDQYEELDDEEPDQVPHVPKYDLRERANMRRVPLIWLDQDKTGDYDPNVDDEVDEDDNPRRRYADPASTWLCPTSICFSFRKCVVIVSSLLLRRSC